MLDTISGYNTKITSGEDWEITDRLVFLGARITRIPLFIRHHLGGFSLSKQAMKKYSYGKTMQNYVRLPNSQMSRRLGVYVSAYAGNLRHVGLYIYPVIFMRSVEALGMFAGITYSTLKTETRRDKSSRPHPLEERIPGLLDS